MIYSTKILNRIKRRKIIACTALIVLCGLTILQTDLSPDLYFIHWGPLENISCHYSEADDTLLRADDASFKPPARSIFFHETSCKGGVDSRQACAVESAAKAHPDWQINLLFAAPVNRTSLDTGRLAVLRNIGNVKLLRVNIAKYATGTPLETMVSGGALNRTRWRISHTSDVLRYLSLYKFGGIYLDLDVLVAKPLDSLARNWAAKETEISVAAGALAFSRDKMGREVAEAAIRNVTRGVKRKRVSEESRDSPSTSAHNIKPLQDFGSQQPSTSKATVEQPSTPVVGDTVECKTCNRNVSRRDIKRKYRGDVWGNNGPGVITRILQERCEGDVRTLSAATCDGFEVYGPQFFYPVHWKNALIYFEPGEIDEETAYIFHVWNKITSNSKVYKGSPYSKLAKKYCPEIYNSYREDFGR